MKDQASFDKMADKPKTKKKLRGGLSSGSTLINLAISGSPYEAFHPGHYYLLVGDSSSGKSWLSLTCFAEATLNPKFKDYRLIYDDSEQGALMDKTFYFGKGVNERLEPPRGSQKDPLPSHTVEEMFFHLDDAIKTDRPFIYVKDSMDSLTTDADDDKFDAQKKAAGSGKDITGSYGTAKAKALSSNMPRILKGLQKTKSILIIISQTRDNIGFGAQFNPKTRSGGKALRFYATVELWTSVREHLNKTVRGKKVDYGIISRIQIKKNRIQGREPIVEVPILNSSGIDDIGSCIDYLVEWKHWSDSKGSVTAPEFEFKGRTETLIKKIEEDNLERDLRSLVSKVWAEIEIESATERKKRYV